MGQFPPIVISFPPAPAPFFLSFVSVRKSNLRRLSAKARRVVPINCALEFGGVLGFVSLLATLLGGSARRYDVRPHGLNILLSAY